MSKTTIALFVILLFLVSVLFSIANGTQNSSIIKSFTQPIQSITSPLNTNLSLSVTEQSVHPGQTITVAVVIHNSAPHPNVIQLELSYDPTVLTIESITPGTFFTDPTIALQNIDTLSGRISYALRCPSSETSTPKNSNNCVDQASSTVAIITARVNPYAFKKTTPLTFLPKTVIRTASGKNILQSTSGLELSLSNAYPISSASAIASPGASTFRVTPIH